MGSARGTENTALVSKDVEERLWDEPFGFHFFQAVRLLENLLPNRRQVGHFLEPAEEIARFTVNPSLSFPPSDIHALTFRDDEPPLMAVNFMGLLGSHGVLPRCYTELVAARLAARDTALRDFLDLFHHRLISLFYRAWRKHQVLERPGEGLDSLARVVMSVVGLGTPGLANRQPVADASLLFYAGLIAQQPHSAASLRLILGDYFDVDVQIEQFVGAWYRLDSRAQCEFDESERESNQLGRGAVVGDEVWEPTAKVRVILGPLSRDRYLDFLPGGAAHAPLRAMVRFFSDEIDFEAQLVLSADQAPVCVLGEMGDTAPKLGWMTWVKTHPMNRNPADTIIPL